ncbi:AAA family ATPase [Mycobacterium sp. CVI_P3]|uniref:AAA family ATPase n=1 Tax=Mycobacterium pinniadriaticum TaxID=2994102 RepID=A0ABT3SCM1_9MYCO|nr:AAA family ATPase [Mycobacterium pinniadriaticum]MCX2930842.1 AAA family ATPase [Mycobacterium pinniadriaticum]MCX2937266.1 AAA family ATPase [Mycobacterium pinniadriaticum]
MRLHRLVLTNYRGIAHREIQFPDHGVVVVCGANEIGKTSMIEALDLLLESKDRSTKKEVKQVKPTHADVGSEVLAEISTGPYRFVYRKRFHKKCETELTILAPFREQLTGDEAHDRVLAMLGETVDTGLWHAQRVLQAGSTSAVDLSECDALSRALDLAAGDDAALSGTEPLLIERIDAEYGRYFTATGRPTGEWAAAIARLRTVDEEVARCAAAVAEVDDRVRRHADLAQRQAGLTDRRDGVAARLAAARAAAGALAELAEQLRQAELVATAARGTCAASSAAQAERVRLRDEMTARTRAVTEVQAQLATAVEAARTASDVAEMACAAATDSATALTTAQTAVDEARRVVDALASEEQARRLATRLERVEAAEREIGDLTDQLSEITLTAEVIADIESAAALVDRIAAQLAATGSTVEFTAARDLDLAVGGQTVRLSAGQRWAPASSSETIVELPGLVSVRIDPGATTSGVQAKLEAAQRILTELLQQSGATDIEDARAIDRRRRDLAGNRDHLAATLAGLCEGDDVVQMRARLAALHDDAPAELLTAGVDGAGARAAFVGAIEARESARAEADLHQRAAAEANAKLAEKSTAATVLRSKVTDAGAELDAATQRLADLRSLRGDDELAAQAAADVEARDRAELVAAELAQRYAAADPAAVEAELAAATAVAEDLDREYAEVAQALNDVTVELGVMGNEGRKGSLDAAQIAREHAFAEHSRVSRRARAAQLLRSVMVRHRDNTRQRYVQPFRTEIERLGRPVFGPTFEVEIDSDLRIRNRTLDGRTVPYESLSGGAKEQLGILARLAGAALVAAEDTVPVVIDDALGFTDPERLTKMGAVFDTVGDHGQVIVLTCTPTRYLGVQDAHVIELTG